MSEPVATIRNKQEIRSLDGRLTMCDGLRTQRVQHMATLLQNHPSDLSEDVLGRATAKETLAYLESIGDSATAAELQKAVANDPHASSSSPLSLLNLFKPKPWQFTSIAAGFIQVPAPPIPPAAVLAIRDVGTVPPNPALIGQAIKVTLDRIRAADFPGTGVHNVLFQFQARHQVAGGGPESLSFAQTYRVKESQFASVRGAPVFINLLVPQEGLSFEMKIVNVSNEGDEAALRLFESDTVKQGLALIPVVNPAVKVITDIATSAVTSLLKSNRNRLVLAPQLGLDFAGNPLRAALERGSYLIVQVDDGSSANWNWAAWEYNVDRGAVVSVADHVTHIPYNYFIVSVS